MQRLKPEDGASMDEMMLDEEETKKQARIGVITHVAVFAGIVLALRMGKSTIIALCMPY